ncbi:MAG: hypothetical protein KIH09_04135, partial [Candidatus Freyarchaeota archaeon]|nr:hypothetical protein [Candidatus Jordarchaeia archaeon]
LTPTQSTPQPFAKTELNMHVRAPDEWISPISIQFFEQHWGQSGKATKTSHRESCLNIWVK